MTANRVNRSDRTELQKGAPGHLGRVAKIGISPAVRISPVGVNRTNLGRRSTVLYFSMLLPARPSVLCASAAWRGTYGHVAK